MPKLSLSASFSTSYHLDEMYHNKATNLSPVPKHLKINPLGNKGPEKLSSFQPQELERMPGACRCWVSLSLPRLLGQHSIPWMCRWHQGFASLAAEEHVGCLDSTAQPLFCQPVPLTSLLSKAYPSRLQGKTHICCKWHSSARLAVSPKASKITNQNT